MRTLPRIKFLMLAVSLGLCLTAGATARAESGLAKNELELFRRCYAHLTGRALKLDDVRIARLRGGATTALTECTTLLRKATINNSDPQGRLVSPNDAEGLLVLQRFYSVFTGFIQDNSARRNLANFFEDFPSTEDVYDTTVLGLALVENMMNPQRRFSDVFSLSRSPVAYREIDSTVTYPFTIGTMYSTSDATPILSPRARHGLKFAGNVSPDTASYALLYGGTRYQIPLATIGVGELKGVNYASPVQTINVASQPSITSFAGVPFGFDMNAPIFAGLFNLRPYILANTNLFDGNSTRPNLEYMPRRLIQSVFRDLMCRELPVLRETDITSYLSTDASAIAFRKGSSCLRCHGTMDQAASVYRGLGYISAGDRDDSIFRYALHPSVSLPVAGNASETGWPAIKDPNFYKRPAKGRLFFRSISGQLIDVPLAGGSDLSAALGQTDDAYACQARKMFEYFTGVRVDLFDPYDPSQASRMAAMSQKDWEFRNFVLKLGQDLKSHQKLRTLVEDILNSPYYKRSDYGAGSM